MRALAAGADVNTAFDSELPLIAAVRSNNLDLVRRLLAPPISADVNLREPDRHGYAPLHVACRRDNLGAIGLLVAAGADPSLPTAGDRPKSLVQLIDEPETLRNLVSLPGVSPRAVLEWRDRDGRTPLLRACRELAVRRAGLLLAAGADVHAVDDESRGALHQVAGQERSKRQLALLKRLLEHGRVTQHGGGGSRGGGGGAPLDVDARDDAGCTPLMLAARQGNGDAIAALLAAGANVAAVDDRRQTALHQVGAESEVIFKDEHTDAFTLLVEAGGSVYALDNDDKSPLDMALEWYDCNLDVIKEAIEEVPQLRAELASVSANLQALIVGAAAEMRRLGRARKEQKERARELRRRAREVRQREEACEERERQLGKRRPRLR